jgi:hypothetical protein
MTSNNIYSMTEQNTKKDRKNTRTRTSVHL